MFFPRNVKEEGEGILTFVSAVIALEGVGVAVVAHVDRVHGLVLERDAAELAHQLLRHGGWLGDGHEGGHGGGRGAFLLVRVGVLLLHDLESLPLPAALAGRPQGGGG